MLCGVSLPFSWLATAATRGVPDCAPSTQTTPTPQSRSSRRGSGAVSSPEAVLSLVRDIYGAAGDLAGQAVITRLGEALNTHSALWVQRSDCAPTDFTLLGVVGYEPAFSSRTSSTTEAPEENS